MKIAKTLLAANLLLLGLLRALGSGAYAQDRVGGPERSAGLDSVARLMWRS